MARAHRHGGGWRVAGGGTHFSQRRRRRRMIAFCAWFSSRDESSGIGEPSVAAAQSPPSGCCQTASLWEEEKYPLPVNTVPLPFGRLPLQRHEGQRERERGQSSDRRRDRVAPMCAAQAQRGDGPGPHLRRAATKARCVSYGHMHSCCITIRGRPHRAPRAGRWHGPPAECTCGRSERRARRA